MITGIAYHWYTGEHFEALRLVHENFPEKKLILSEFCVAPEFTPKGPFAYAHELIGDLNEGTQAVYDWNLLLDSQGGPNHVGNFCDAAFRYHKEKAELERRIIAENLWHFAHFIQPNAVRIAFSSYTTKLELTAFENPDGSVAIVALNQTTEDIPIVLMLDGAAAELALEAKTLLSATFV